MDLARLQTFGADAYPLLPDEERAEGDKLSARAPGGDGRYGGSGYADGGSGAGVQSSPGMQGGGGYGGPPAQGSTGAS